MDVPRSVPKIKLKAHCTAYGCANTNRNQKLTFFSLPKDDERRRKWLKLIDREDLLKKENLKRKTHLVCSAHFEDDYLKKIVHLKSHAVPTKQLKKPHEESCSKTQSASASEKKVLGSKSDSNSNSEDETGYPDLETFNKQALSITLARIRKNPQLYIGIPKNCYHLIDIMHKTTKIPTAHILLCLKKVKLDTHFEELADQFGITTHEANHIFTSNISALANILQSFVNTQDLQKPLQLDTCVIDCLEINVQPFSVASSELTQTERGNTVKYVICCTPDGYINYVSPGYGGRQSDARLLEVTNYLDQLKSGNTVITNGLSNVEPMLLQRGLKVVKPRAREKECKCLISLGTNSKPDIQLSDDELKILVQRVREFTMVKDHSALSSELVTVLDEVMLIACALVNLQSCLLN